MARALTATCVLALLLGGCLGDGDDAPERIHGDVATVYASVPRHGISAPDGRAMLAGARRALADRDGRAGDLRIRLRALPSTEDDDRPWEPALVAANADRAAEDPNAIAYLGELDHGASAVSLPITNDAGLLQVSPGDGLTSLTQQAPGRPRAGPERHYPSGIRSFVRIGPADLVEAESVVERARAAGTERLALVFDRGIYGREMAVQISTRARRAGLQPVASEQFDGRPDSATVFARSLAEERPNAVIHAGLRERGTVQLLVAIDAALPEARLFATSGILAGDLSVPAGPARLLAVGPALSPERSGYAAMRVVLDAVREGRRDRERVIAAARKVARSRHDERIGIYRPGRDGRFGQAAISP